MPKLNSPPHVLLTTLDLLPDALRVIRLSLQPNWALAAENLFLRKCLSGFITPWDAVTYHVFSQRREQGKVERKTE
jgi:hypothetical protein